MKKKKKYEKYDGILIIEKTSIVWRNYFNFGKCAKEWSIINNIKKNKKSLIILMIYVVMFHVLK